MDTNYLLKTAHTNLVTQFTTILRQIDHQITHQIARFSPWIAYDIYNGHLPTAAVHASRGGCDGQTAVACGGEGCEKVFERHAHWFYHEFIA